MRVYQSLAPDKEFQDFDDVDFSNTEWSTAVQSIADLRQSSSGSDIKLLLNPNAVAAVYEHER